MILLIQKPLSRWNNNVIKQKSNPKIFIFLEILVVVVSCELDLFIYLFICGYLKVAAPPLNGWHLVIPYIWQHEVNILYSLMFVRIFKWNRKCAAAEIGRIIVNVCPNLQMEKIYSATVEIGRIIVPTMQTKINPIASIQVLFLITSTSLCRSHKELWSD